VLGCGRWTWRAYYRGADVLDYLRSLGDTPDAIADTLAQLGVRGKLDDPFACPLVVALTDHLDLGIDEVSVTHDRIEWGYRGAYEWIPTPPACAAFIARFDEGHYPYLKAPYLETEAETEAETAAETAA
jgi:hypothetical protein